MTDSRDSVTSRSHGPPRLPSLVQRADRIVGIDLALTGPHVYVAVDSRYQPLWKPRKAIDELESLEQMYQTCREGLEAEQIVVWVMEATGTAWMRMLSFLRLKGEEAIYAPSSRKFSNLRKTLSIGVKNDKVDALALAKLPAVAGEVLKPLVLPSQELLALGRIVRMLERITKEATGTKLQSGALMGLLNPGALKLLQGEGGWTAAVRRFVGQAYDPRAVKSERKLRQILNPGGKASQEVASDKLTALFAVCQRNAELVERWEREDLLPVHLESLKIEVASHLEHLAEQEKRRKLFEKERDKWFKLLDPDSELLSITGIGIQLSAVILAYTGPIERFANLRSYKGFIGHVPGSGQSGGDKPAKGHKITKAGPNPLKAAYYLAGENARRVDPQLAEFACRLQERGLEYDQIIVAVGNKVAARVYSVLKRRYKRDCAAKAAADGEVRSRELVLYELRTPEGEPVSKPQARQLIEEQYRLKTKRNPNPSRSGQEKTTPVSVDNTSVGTSPPGEEAQRAVQSPGQEESNASRNASVVGNTTGGTIRPGQQNDEAHRSFSGSDKQQTGYPKKIKGPPPDGTRQPVAPQGGTDPDKIEDIIERARCRAELKVHLRLYRTELGEGLLAYLQRPDVDEELLTAQLRVLELRRQHRDRHKAEAYSTDSMAVPANEARNVP